MCSGYVLFHLINCTEEINTIISLRYVQNLSHLLLVCIYIHNMCTCACMYHTRSLVRKGTYMYILTCLQVLNHLKSAEKRCKDSNGKTTEIIHGLSINFNENVVYNVPYLSFYSTHFFDLSSATTSKPYLWYRRTACNNHARMGFSCLCLSAMSYLHCSVISTPTVRVRFSMFCYPYVHTTFSGNVSHALFFEGGGTLVCLSVSVGQYIIIKKNIQ